MNMPYTRAPHRGDPVGSGAGLAPNAALLIDFDNVTMGMRSDLSRDLKKLLDSDVIRGKVTVQRAYADWRRYPQYIVPLSENSIDLIFAPAYGSSKKNATDIRMAIDAVELVFTRPEIGIFILLTGDSDFSSCVLKLKEYGKYVIGVGIQESSSDILVQNCDEYYSYTSLTGLTKTTGGDQLGSDPWVLVDQAIRRMADRSDVMRSDRLKQVMIELDSGFDEGKFGYSKFSRFLADAASRNLVQIRKLENGQYEVSPGTGRASASGSGSGSSRRERDEGGRSRRGRRDGRDDRREGRDERRAEGGASAATAEGAAVEGAGAEGAAAEAGAPRAQAADGDALRGAYALLIEALEALRDDGRHPCRDSDVKRRMLEMNRDFDEAELGFPKFSRFLRQAHDDEIVDLAKEDGGNYQVSLRAPGAPRVSTDVVRDEAGAAAAAEPAEPAAPAVVSMPVVRELRPEDVIAPDAPGRRLGPRGGATRRRDDEAGPPPFLPGQVPEGAGDDNAAVAAGAEAESEPAGDAGGEVDELGLPLEAAEQVDYLTFSYRGVGKKTAEALVERFGRGLWDVLRTQPDLVREVVPAGRAEALLEAWNADLRRRQEPGGATRSGGRRGRRGGRGRGGGGGGGSRRD